MPRTICHARLRPLLASAVVLACAGPLGAARAADLAVDAGWLLPRAGGPGSPPRCPDTGRRPSSTSHRRARAALLCAINRARVSHALPALAANRALRRAAGRQAADMVRRHYFAHVRPGGPDVGSRLRAAGWSGTAYGEALAWGCGRLARPRAIVRGWLRSPPHRAILLSPLFRDTGIGVADRAPAGCGGGTWVLDTGRG